MTFWAKKFAYFMNQAVGRIPEEDRMIDGTGIVIKIDTTVISKKMEYNKESIKPEIWIFDGKE